MKYGMIADLIPQEYEKEFRANAKNTMQDAANALQWNLYRGFCANLGEAFPLFNLLPCGSFPQYYKHPFIPGFSFDKKGENLSFCNVKLIRNYFKTKALTKALKKWCKSTQESKTLFVYTISQPLLKAVSKIKKNFNNLHICAIVADLPDMSNLSSQKSLILQLFMKQKAKESYTLLSCVDSFVLLTKHMAEYMEISQPFCVMEGIASPPAAEGTIPPKDKKEKIVLYTGTLHRKFGILHLLEAFQMISDQDMKLVICGIGDSEAEIKAAAEKDPRICFMGQQPRNEVLSLQRQATVLVNPRQNNEEFTKYSFPSKTMEYLASGVPVIAYKLDGMPDEYDEYIIYPEDESSESLALVMNHVCSLKQEERSVKGEKGKRYVLEQKNSMVQTRRILDFLLTVQNGNSN